RKKGNNESISNIGVVKGGNVNHISHHPSSSLSSSPSSQSANSLSLQSEQWNDQSRSSLGANQQNTLGVSSNPIIKRGSMFANREDRTGTPEPRENAASPVFG